MNILLVDSFKNLCQGQLAELIKSCYLVVEPLSLNKKRARSLDLFGVIYTPCVQIHQLLNYTEELDRVGKKLGINFIQIIPLGQKDLNYYLETARSSKNIADWKRYLELQYLL